jgi:hypothetical protein
VAACRGRSRATACGGLVFRHPVLTAVPKSRPCRHVPARASRTRLDGRAQHSGRLSHRRRRRNTRGPKLAKELVELQSIYKYLFAATHEPAVGHDS